MSHVCQGGQKCVPAHKQKARSPRRGEQKKKELKRNMLENVIGRREVIHEDKLAKAPERGLKRETSGEEKEKKFKKY